MSDMFRLKFEHSKILEYLTYLKYNKNLTTGSK